MSGLLEALAVGLAAALGAWARREVREAEREQWRQHPRWCDGCGMTVLWGELHTDCERRGEVEGGDEAEEWINRMCARRRAMSIYEATLADEADR